MNADDRELLKEIREQNREILKLLNNGALPDGGLTVTQIASAPDPIAAIRERNRQVKSRQKTRKS
jgi:hypothetical protein